MKVIILIIVILFDVHLYTAPVYSADKIPLKELHYEVVVDEANSNFLSLVQTQCPFVKIINDVNAPDKVFLGSTEFVVAHAPPAQLSMIGGGGTHNGMPMLHMLQIDGHGGYSSGSETSIESSAESFAQNLCRKNEVVDNILSKRLPIFVYRNMPPFESCDSDQPSQNCNQLRTLFPIITELDQMLLNGDGFMLYPLFISNHQMPYELRASITKSSDEHLKLQLVLIRFLNGAIVGNQKMIVTLADNSNNNSAIREARHSITLANRIQIMNWLAERVEDQEWKEEEVLDKVGANH